MISSFPYNQYCLDCCSTNANCSCSGVGTIIFSTTTETLTARELSPCIVLLDNIDMILGSGSSGSSNGNNIDDNEDTSKISGTNRSNKSSFLRTSTKAKSPQSSRTRHHAVDRMLSTLLVEIDGIFTPSSSSFSSASSSYSSTATSGSNVSAGWILVANMQGVG